MSSCVEAEGMVYMFGLAGGDDFDNCDDEFRTAAVVQRIVRLDDASGIDTPDDPSDDAFTFIDINGTSVCLQNKIKSNRLNGVETSNVILSEYEISFSDGTSRTQALAAAIEADASDGSSGLDGSIAITPITLFDSPGLTNFLGQAQNAGQVETVAGIIFRGRTTGGLDIETPEYFFPVEIFPTAFCYCSEPPDAMGFTPLCGNDLQGSLCPE